MNRKFTSHPPADMGWVVKLCLCAQSILPQQRLLAEESGWEAVLAIVRDEEVCERLRGRWQRDQGRLTNGDISCERWAELCSEIDKVLPGSEICWIMTWRAFTQAAAAPRCHKGFLFASTYLTRAMSCCG